MKTYALFAGSNYYPNGGADEIVGYFDTHQEAIDDAFQMVKDWDDYLNSDHLARPKHQPDWWHVAETATMEIVATS